MTYVPHFYVNSVTVDIFGYLFVNKIVDQYVQILYCGNRKSYASEDYYVGFSEKKMLLSDSYVAYTNF